jgi:glycosyltransferase involved in cell wall biosynthesis
MLRSISNKSLSLAIRKGQFAIRPLKKVYKVHKERPIKYAYNSWSDENDRQCFAGDHSRSGPLVSIVVPVYNTELSDYLAMVYSVINQHYESWEMIIVNASSDPASRKQVDESASIDTRIKVIEQKNNQGISINTNLGIKSAIGKYIAFLDHDDVLHPCALHASLDVIGTTGAELTYSDEDKIKADSSLFFEPFRKPKYSPDLLMNVNYFNHLTIIKADFVKQVGGLREECDGAQDFDMLLRIINKYNPKIVHIPRVLYHWRAAATSTASSTGTKPKVLEAGTKALQHHIDNVGIKGTAHSIVNRPGFYEINFEQPKSITIVVGKVAEANHRLVGSWLSELLNSLPEYGNVQIIVGDWLKVLKPDLSNHEITYLAHDNYWSNAAKEIKGETVLCLRDALVPQTKDAISKVIGRAYQQDVIVAPVIISSGGTIIDAGLVKTISGHNQPLFKGNKLGDSTYFGTTEWVRNVDALNLNVFAASRHNASKLFEGLHNQSDTSLKNFLKSNPDTRLVLDAQAPMIFKAHLMPSPLINNTYFNPELTQAFAPSINVDMSDWGQTKDRSERENV